MEVEDLPLYLDNNRFWFFNRIGKSFPELNLKTGTLVRKTSEQCRKIELVEQTAFVLTVSGLKLICIETGQVIKEYESSTFCLSPLSELFLTISENEVASYNKVKKIKSVVFV